MKIKPLLITIGIAFMLSGCGAGELEKTSAYGEPAYKIKCSNTPESCLEEAYNKCNGGAFTTIYSDSHAGGFLADFIPGPTTWYALTFKCGGAGTMPQFPWRGTTTQEAIQMMQTTPAPTTTNCRKSGNRVRCTTY